MPGVREESAPSTMLLGRWNESPNFWKKQPPRWLHDLKSGFVCLKWIWKRLDLKSNVEFLTAKAFTKSCGLLRPASPVPYIISTE